LESRLERKNQNFTKVVHKENINRIKVVVVTIMIIISLLIVRLAYIQLIKGDELSLKAANQWVKEIPIGAQRGMIFDRNMNPLTNKKRSNFLYILPEYFPKTLENILVISQITGISNDELYQNELIRSRPFTLKVENRSEELFKKALGIKGVFPIESEERYSADRLAAHVIGYINKIDNTGEKGLEKSFDEILKENQQYKVGVIVDAQKKMIPGLNYKIIEANKDSLKYSIVTTLDSTIQKIAEEELDATGKNGSIIVLDAKNGEILAMASRPNYNPDNVADYLDSKNKELFNRAIQISYPPGSIFKIVVLAAVLEEGLVSVDEEFFCNGYEEFGDIKIKCSSYDKGGHGVINLQDAFSQSCNSVFIQLGKAVGGEKIIEMAEKMGFGNITGVELSEEIPGQLPSIDYTKGAGIGNISIGQGTLEVTPLQIARMTSIIVNNGKDHGVYLIKKIIDDKGKTLETLSKDNTNIVISTRTSKIIQEMMERVVEIGTGKRIELDELGGAAGKTGSAEAISNGSDTVHAWFTGYFPINNPQYVITILVEDGGSGGTIAAPVFGKIARRIVLEYNNGQK